MVNFLYIIWVFINLWRITFVNIIRMFKRRFFIPKTTCLFPRSVGLSNQPNSRTQLRFSPPCGDQRSNIMPMTVLPQEGSLVVWWKECGHESMLAGSGSIICRLPFVRQMFPPGCGVDKDPWLAKNLHLWLGITWKYFAKVLFLPFYLTLKPMVNLVF